MRTYQNHDTDMFAFQQFYLLCEKRRDFIVVVVVKKITGLKTLPQHQ